MTHGRPVVPFEIKPQATIADALEAMEGISFQARMLGRAFRIWRRMVEDDVFIFFGLAGAMVPAGLRKVIVALIENRLLDCIVSTGANLFHDLHETLGFHHYAISPDADDDQLRKERLDRIYDTCGVDQEFNQSDYYIIDFARGLDPAEPLTTAEFFARLGRKLEEDKKDDGIITAAARCGVPIFCPALGDSSYGIALALLAEREGHNVVFDLVGDVAETARLTENHKTGIIFVGGGTPKNFVQQAEITVSMLRGSARGHHYAIQITTDAPHWGGLSGCTFQEAKSWGKIAEEARTVTVYCDATIALPLLACGLVQAGVGRTAQRTSPATA